jgi:hypothetical protein
MADPEDLLAATGEAATVSSAEAANNRMKAQA